jgi:hypothetical protein
MGAQLYIRLPACGLVRAVLWLLLWCALALAGSCAAACIVAVRLFDSAGAWHGICIHADAASVGDSCASMRAAGSVCWQEAVQEGYVVRSQDLFGTWCNLSTVI